MSFLDGGLTQLFSLYESHCLFLLKMDALSIFSFEKSKWSKVMLFLFKLDLQTEGTFAFFLFLEIYGEMRDGRRRDGFD